MGEKTASRSVTLSIAFLIVLSGVGFIFNGTARARTYSDNDGVPPSEELTYTKSHTFDLSFYSGTNDTGGGSGPPGITSIDLSSSNSYYARQVWRKEGIDVECGGIKEINCEVSDIDTQAAVNYQFKLYPEGHADLCTLEEYVDLENDSGQTVIIDESYGSDSKYTCNPYSFFFEDNPWRIKIEYNEGDDDDKHIKVGDVTLTITTCSSPGMTDTDGDGYDDGEENYTHNTDPIDEDTDGDGWNDGPTNQITKLKLKTIKDDATNFRSVFAVFEDERRYPGYDEWWDLSSGDTTTIETVVDKRVKLDSTDAFTTRIKPTINYDGSYDDLAKKELTGWQAPVTGSNSYTVSFHDGVDTYEFEFTAETENISDPDPLSPTADSDGDGLSNQEEYSMSDKETIDGRAIPGEKDIFVEIDYMSGHFMKYDAAWRVGTRFLNNPTGEKIWLHMDQGKMGGGENVGFEEGTTTDNEFNGDGLEDINRDDLYGNHFTDDRQGLFYYSLFVNDGEREQDGTCWDHSFIICDDNMYPKIEDQAQTFMHELGHGLGLDKHDYKGIDNDTCSYSEYPSVMNYNWDSDNRIDYSHGTGYDDWANLDDMDPYG